MENISFKYIPIQITKTNDEVVILNTLHRLEVLFPEIAKETLGFISDLEPEDVCKAIRQRSNFENSTLFYDLLNGSFGLKVISLLKNNYEFFKEELVKTTKSLIELEDKRMSQVEQSELLSNNEDLAELLFNYCETRYNMDMDDSAGFDIISISGNIIYINYNFSVNLKPVSFPIMVAVDKEHFSIVSGN